MEDVVIKLKRLICHRLNLEYTWRDMPDDFQFKDSGLDLDSVESLELVIGIEQTFKIQVMSHEINREILSSLPKLAEYVLGKLELIS